MPVANITEARDIVIGMLQTAWEAQVSPPTLFFEDQDDDAPNTAYAVATLRHMRPPVQATVGEATTVRYNSPASLIVDIFTPYGQGMNDADAYVIVVQKAFIGRKSIPDKIWFRAVSVTEMPRQGALKKTRVVVNFEYDELY